MKYLIKYNNGKDTMLIKNDLAFKGYIDLAVVQNRDIKDFHVIVIPDNETVFRCRYADTSHFYTLKDLQEFLEYEGEQYPDLRITIV